MTALVLLLSVGMVLLPRPATSRARGIEALGVVGNGAAAGCDEAAFDAGLAAGGALSFDCGSGPVTIAFSGPKPITGNTSIDGGGAVTLLGGGTAGIFQVPAGVTLELRNVTITGGNAGDGEGGNVRSAGTLRVVGSVISGGRAGSGGGVFNDHGTVEIRDSTLEGNTAAIGGGGALYNDAGGVTITGSTLSGNSSALFGGAISNRTGTLAIVNSTLSGNDATLRGGGIYSAGNLAADFSTFVSNSAPFGEGGNLYSAGTVTIGSNVFAAGVPGNCGGFGTFTSTGHNLSSDRSCASSGSGDQSGLDPRLGPLQPNGGPTRTHALLGGSPAIDRGDAAGCPATDQRGVARPIDGDGDTAPTCDAGAFEAPLNTGPSAPGTPMLAAGSVTPNQGDFTLQWAASSDPQGDPLTYTLRHRPADQTDGEYTDVATGIAASSYTFSVDRPEAEGTWTYVVVASDGALTSASSPPSVAITVEIEPRGTTVRIPPRRPRPPGHGE